MTQNGNINPLFHLGGNFYGHIRIQHYQYHQKLRIPYNPYLAHGALSKLKFPIGNIYCIIPKKRTPQPLQLSIIAISISYEVGQEQKAIFLVVILK